MRINVIAGIIITAIGSQCAVATNLNHYDLERRIFDASHQLNQIAEDNRTDLCSGDVLIAAAYLESSGAELQHHKKDRALVSMTYGHNELKEISNVRSYCAYLSPKVKPFLARVIVMKSELENITIPETDQTSD
jgi:sensor c-di-GMP phosphodiesterase-like protein